MKNGEFGQFADLRGLGKKEGVVFLRGVDTSMHTMWFPMTNSCNKT